MAVAKRRFFKRSKPKTTVVKNGIADAGPSGKEDSPKRQESPKIYRSIPESSTAIQDKSVAQAHRERASLQADKHGEPLHISRRKVGAHPKKPLVSAVMQQEFSGIPQNPPHSTKSNFFSLEKVRVLKSVSLKGLSVLQVRLFFCLVAVGIAVDIVVGIFLYRTVVSWSGAFLARQELSNEMATWEDISQKYPTYRDAYVEGALIAYEIGDKSKEDYFLQKLMLLDPNFPISKALEDLENTQSGQNN